MTPPPDAGPDTSTRPPPPPPPPPDAGSNTDAGSDPSGDDDDDGYTPPSPGNVGETRPPANRDAGPKKPESKMEISCSTTAGTASSGEGFVAGAFAVLALVAGRRARRSWATA